MGSRLVIISTVVACFVFVLIEELKQKQTLNKKSPPRKQTWCFAGKAWPEQLRLSEDTTSSWRGRLSLQFPGVLMKGDVLSWFLFFIVLRATCSGLAWSVCARVHVCVVLLGTVKRARAEQMGPLNFALAWKMKGGENCNKKRKQLWQDNSSLWGGPKPGGWQSVKTVLLGWV